METIRVYKLFRRDEVGIHPLFIDKFVCLPMGNWIEARAPSELALSYEPEGYSLMHLYHDRVVERRTTNPTAEDVSRACIRFCRWIYITVDRRGKRRYYDLGIGSNGKVLWFAHRPGWHSLSIPQLPAVNMNGKVWAECLIPADDNYVLHRNISGLSKTHAPIDWYISQKLFIVKII